MHGLSRFLALPLVETREICDILQKGQQLCPFFRFPTPLRFLAKRGSFPVRAGLTDGRFAVGGSSHSVNLRLGSTMDASRGTQRNAIMELRVCR